MKSKKSGASYRNPYTVRSIIRQIYKEAGMLDLLPKLRNVPTDAEKALAASHLPKELAQVAEQADDQQMLKDLAQIGIFPGKTAGTKPELATAYWLLKHNYQYGGMSYSFDPNSDWGFQVPLEGGRAGAGGGAVADIFLTAKSTNTKAGVVVRVNGVYWHTRPGAEPHDRAQQLRLEAKGFAVKDLWDYQALNPGQLDTFMKELLGAGSA